MNTHNHSTRRMAGEALNTAIAAERDAGILPEGWQNPPIPPSNPVIPIAQYQGEAA